MHNEGGAPDTAGAWQMLANAIAEEGRKLDEVSERRPQIEAIDGVLPVADILGPQRSEQMVALVGQAQIDQRILPLLLVHIGQRIADERLQIIERREPLLAVVGQVRIERHRAAIVEPSRRPVDAEPGRDLGRERQPVAIQHDARQRQRIIFGVQQNRSNPPPLHSETADFKALEEWTDLCRVFGFKLGLGEGRDWDLTFALLGLYEFTSAEPKPTIKANNATMRFLETTLNELSKLVPPESRKCFSLPEQGTLKQQLKANPYEVSAKKRAIARLWERQG